MMDKLGFGLIGAGGIGIHHGKRLLAQPRARLVALTDPDARAAESASAELGVEAMALDALLAREDIGAVLVATPNFAHYDVTLRAILGGKHVFLEKPMARTIQECDDMIAAANAAGVKLAVGQVLRLMPPFVRIREMVASGRFGRPMEIETSRLMWSSWTQPWRLKKDLAWGMLHESNIHELDFMRAICGEAVEVDAKLERLVRMEADYEDTALVIVRYASGALGLMRGSYASTIPSTDGRIICEKATITYSWRQLRIEYRMVGEAENEVVQLSGSDFEDAYGLEQASFVDWVLDGTAPVVTAADGRAAVELCEAAYLSAERGGPVKLPL
jgi:predicted dehydrogenase